MVDSHLVSIEKLKNRCTNKVFQCKTTDDLPAYRELIGQELIQRAYEYVKRIAVTGSVNQKGLIQPVGGINEKIEGFYKICKVKGLTGEEGVIIPHQNVKNLMLDDEIIEYVKEGKFNIYAIKTIDEGIEILTGVKAGMLDENNEYEKNTINYLVEKKLEYYSKLNREYE